MTTCSRLSTVHRTLLADEARSLMCEILHKELELAPENLIILLAQKDSERREGKMTYFGESRHRIGS